MLNYSEEKKCFVERLLEINLKRNKDAKINFVLSFIILLLKEILSKIDTNFTEFSIKYYHDKGLDCRKHGRNNYSINNLYWWTSEKGRI
jgi:hypothetical protein